MNKLSKNLRVLLSGGILLLLGSGVVILTNAQTEKVDRALSGSNTAPAVQQVKQDAISYEGQVGKTAMELLKANYTVQTKESTYGEFVVAIEGMEGNGPKYWLFYVDDKQSEVGASAYTTKDGEKIEWRLE